MSDADMSTEERIIRYLKERGLTVTTAESCTGGLLAGRLLDVPGASAVYNEGYITYSNEAKERLLGVPRDVLGVYGAVSEETAAAMATGASRAAGAYAALSTTGIAGPGGGSPKKPVGLIYIGCAVGEHIAVKKCLFHGDRGENRDAAVRAALKFLWEELSGRESSE